MMSWAGTRGFARSYERAASATCWACPAPPRCATWRPHGLNIKGEAVAPRPHGNKLVASFAHWSTLGEYLVKTDAGACLNTRQTRPWDKERTGKKRCNHTQARPTLHNGVPRIAL